MHFWVETTRHDGTHSVYSVYGIATAANELRTHVRHLRNYGWCVFRYRDADTLVAFIHRLDGKGWRQIRMYTDTFTD